MNQKELNEIRRRFKLDKNSISKIFGCYVNSNKEIISWIDASMGLMQQEEQEMYLGLLKKALSGALGKNLVDITFSTAQVADSDEHRLLQTMRQTELKDPASREDFCRRLIGALNMPISLMILRSAFAAIPTELEEAAYIDGAGFFRTFWQVMMPCAKGGLASAAVLAFLGSWNEFTFALLLTSSTSTRTLPLSLSYFTSQFSFNYTAMFAAITIAVLPSIIVFSIFQEQVCSSLTAGSVKG